MSLVEGQAGRTGSASPCPITAHGGGSGATANSVPRDLLSQLEWETRTALVGVKRVALLLTGGMDSRIVAGVLQRLEDAGELEAEVVAVTWGVDGARDVAYAGRIAREFGWRHTILDLGPEQLKRNILLAGQHGARFAPVHLHAMPDVAPALPELDLVIAASYGDSVGRSEFSGRHVTRLRRHPYRPQDPFGLFAGMVDETYVRRIQEDAVSFRLRAGPRAEWQYREVDHQGHYMRRLLHDAMRLGLGELSLHQAFASEPVYGLMWATPPALRGDQTYEMLLESLHPILKVIPWARTGRPFADRLRRGQDVDTLRRQSHRYGEWLRRDCMDFVLDHVGSLRSRAPARLRMNLDRVVREWSRLKTSSFTRLDEQVCWLASLSVAMTDRHIDLELPKGMGHAALAPALRSTAYRVAKNIRG